MKTAPSPTERRAAPRHRLVPGAVAAAIYPAAGAVARGTARDIALDGALFIETPAPLSFLTATRVTFAMPGLWDNHVHFGGGDALIDENRNLLPLYLAHGITAVRDATGDLSPSVLEWRAKVADGTLLGPTIFTSGPKLEGIDSIWPGDLELGSEADVRAALDRLQAMRVDFV